MFFKLLYINFITFCAGLSLLEVVLYPYHYAPFASDFKNITRVRNDFDRGTTPFAPLEQLMGVFPASSGKFLPLSWRELMMRDVGCVCLSFFSFPPSLSLPLSLYLFLLSFPCIDILYSRKYWRELNLAVEPKIAITRIFVDLNLAVVI